LYIGIDWIPALPLCGYYSRISARRAPKRALDLARGKQRMSDEAGGKIVHSRTPESAAMLASVKRVMTITAKLNCLTFNDADEIRALFSELIGKKIDESFLLIPPFYATGGDEIRVGRNVFVNHNCTFYGLGGLDIADDVMIGPNVSLITSGHPLEPSRRRAATIGKPIAIERNVWIAAGATIVGGVTVGENSVVAAGSVVTKDVPPEYADRRKTGAGHSFDSLRLREQTTLSQRRPAVLSSQRACASALCRNVSKTWRRPRVTGAASCSSEQENTTPAPAPGL
jgi:acetyltransferase-like isoleucine patch superfamily enzyme